MTEQPPPIAVVSDYDGLIEALRGRLAHLGMTHATMDELTGLPGGYTGKIFGAARIKNLSQSSMGLVLNALGVKIVLIEDLETMARFASQREKRSRPAVQTSREVPLGKTTMRRVTPMVLRELSRLGNEARKSKLSPEHRIRIARRAGQASSKARKVRQRLAAKNENA